MGRAHHPLLTLSLATLLGAGETLLTHGQLINGGGVSRGLGVLAGHQHVHIAGDGEGGGDGLVGVVLQRRVVVIGDDENSH